MAFSSNASNFKSPRSEAKNMPFNFNNKVRSSNTLDFEVPSAQILSQSCPVPSAFQKNATPSRPIIKPLAPPPKQPPALALPFSLNETSDMSAQMDMWASADKKDKKGRSYYSSSVPAHLTVPPVGLMSRMQLEDSNTNSASSSGGRKFNSAQTPPLSSPEAPMSSTPSSTIFSFMSGGGSSFEPRHEHIFGSFRAAGSFVGTHMSKVRYSISEEPADFDDDDFPKRGNKSLINKNDKNNDLYLAEDELQFNADSDDDAF